MVFVGAGNSVTVTGLSGGTPYHFAVYEFNGSGGTQNYLTPPAVGNQLTTTTTYTWNATGSASWATAANWTPARSSLAPGDVLVFNGGSAVTATDVPTETIGQLLISSSSSVTLQSTVTSTLTIIGGSGADLQATAVQKVFLSWSQTKD